MDGTDTLPLGAAGDGLVALVRERALSLAVPAPARAEAAEVVRARGLYGMEEPRLHAEWLNDVLAHVPADGEEPAIESARKDPGRAYLAWLSQRVRDPFRVSFRSVRSLVASVGEEDGNAFVHLRWRQEVAWAKRLRSSPDPRTALHAMSFLRLAARDPGKAFTDLAAAWSTALQEPGFARRPEHDWDEIAIRLGSPDTDYVPVFLRLLRVRNKQSMDRMPLEQVSAVARQARAEDERECTLHHAGHAVAAARRTPMSRLTGVIDVALETGRCSDGLVADEDTFLGEVATGRVPVARGVVPYAEFVSWLRAGPPHAPPDPPGPGSAAHAELAALQFRPRAWLAKLPTDYAAMGGDQARTLNDWLSPIALGTRPVPRDLVVDYGFHLVAAAVRR